jgi:hypothetical protein
MLRIAELLAFHIQEVSRGAETVRKWEICNHGGEGIGRMSCYFMPQPSQNAFPSSF